MFIVLYFYRGGPKTNISLVPRAIARKKLNIDDTKRTAANEGHATTSESLPVQQKSNEDFRKLLFKK